jgi:alkanesulfonate monooxygenase SsuD/methylene tetrahydromethanopterin reductase-like flavin-dependent oxidoreductase (luciferase family)
MGTLSDDPERVKFVYWDNLTYSPPGESLDQAWDPGRAASLYEAYLEHCGAAEEMGFAGVSMPEHAGPFSISSHPNIMMAALSQRTRTARIVSGVNIPLWHRPIDLAAEWGMIDTLSGGRLEIGLGRHGDQDANQKAIDLVDAMLHREDVPLPASEGLWALSGHVKPDEKTSMTLWPRAYGKRLPLWVAAGSEGSVAAAAKRGLGLFTGLTTNPQAGGMATGTIDGVLPLFRHYVEVGQQHGHDLSLANVAVISFTVIGDTDEQAQARAMAGLRNHFEKAMATYLRVSGALVTHSDGAAPAIEETAKSFINSPFALIGSLSTVREKLDRLRSVGLKRFITAVGLGLDHQEAWESACAMARDVAPDVFVAEQHAAATIA